MAALFVPFALRSFPGIGAHFLWPEGQIPHWGRERVMDFLFSPEEREIFNGVLWSPFAPKGGKNYFTTSGMREVMATPASEELPSPPETLLWMYFNRGGVQGRWDPVVVTEVSWGSPNPKKRDRWISFDGGVWRVGLTASLTEADLARMWRLNLR